MDELENKFVNRLQEIALEKECKPLPLGYFSLIDQPKQAKEFWNRLSDFCCHVDPLFDGDIEQGIRKEFRFRHGLPL